MHITKIHKSQLAMPNFFVCETTKRQKNPPTPALAQAGAAPGTTGGVEPAGLPSQLKRAFPRELATTFAATCLSHLFSRAFKTLPQAFPRQLATTLAATCPSQVFFNVVYGVRSCRLPTLKPHKPRCRPFQANKSRSDMLHAPAIRFETPYKH